MKCPDDYSVVMYGGFPGDVLSAVRVDNSGYPTVYINDALSMDARRMALRHELWHFEQGDFDNHVTIYDAEKKACHAAKLVHLPRTYRKLTEPEQIRLDICGAAMMIHVAGDPDFPLPLEMPEPLYAKDPLPPIHGIVFNGW